MANAAVLLSSLLISFFLSGVFPRQIISAAYVILPWKN